MHVGVILIILRVKRSTYVLRLAPFALRYFFCFINILPVFPVYTITGIIDLIVFPSEIKNRFFFFLFINCCFKFLCLYKQSSTKDLYIVHPEKLFLLCILFLL